MSLDNSQSPDSSISSLLSKNPKLETLLSSLSVQFCQSRVQLLDTLYFVISNDLFEDSHSVALLLAFMRLAHDCSLFSYLADMSRMVLTRGEGVLQRTVLYFFSDTKLTAALATGVDDLKGLVDETAKDDSAEIMSQKVVSEVAKLPKGGPDLQPVPFFAFRSPGRHTRVLEDTCEMDELLNDFRDYSCRPSAKLTPDFLLPVPVELPVDSNEFATPFPFLLESPLLNPCLPFPRVLNELIAHSARLTPPEEEAT